MATLQHELPARRVADASITARIWDRGVSRPRTVDLEEAADHDGVLHVDVEHGADPEHVYETLLPICGSDLTLAMVKDLLEPDELPKILGHDERRIRAVSAFGVEAKDASGASPSTGTLRFDLVEFLANDSWVVTCSHRARSYAGDSTTDLYESPRRCESLFAGVGRRWVDSDCGSAGDLAVLLLHELTCSYSLAWRKMMRWLDEWERAFYADPDAGDLQSLKDLHALASEFRSRLNALNVPQDEAQTAWFRGVSADAIPKRADKHIDKALEGLDRLGDMLRSAHGIVQAHRAQREQKAAEDRQRNFELAGVLFLVPTLVAGAWGENTWVPGQGKPWGFALTLAVMALGACAAYAMLERHRKKRRA